MRRNGVLGEKKDEEKGRMRRREGLGELGFMGEKKDEEKGRMRRREG